MLGDTSTDIAKISLDEELQAFFALEPASLAERWRLFERLRDEAPACPFGHSVIVTRHEDCASLLFDKQRVISGGPTKGVAPAVLERLTVGERSMLDDITDWEERWLTSVNGDRHTELRNLGQRVFAPRGVAEMRERIEEITEHMLSGLAERDELEFVSEFAYKLPLAVISEILDIPADMREPMHETTKGIRVARTGVTWRMQLPDGLEQAHYHYMEFRRQIRELLEVRRGTQTTTIMSNVLAALDDGFDEDDIIVLVSLLITAGHKTTTELLGSGVYTFLTHREQWERLCDDPSLVTDAVEELLRYRSPAQEVERFAAVDFDLHGVEIHRGDHISVYIGSANLDPRAFREPERFDIDRDDSKKHLSFGRGPHFCLGNALTRLEANVVFPALARRYPDMELVEQQPEWVPTTRALGLARLPLVMGADHG